MHEEEGLRFVIDAKNQLDHIHGEVKGRDAALASASDMLRKFRMEKIREQSLIQDKIEEIKKESQFRERFLKSRYDIEIEKVKEDFERSEELLYKKIDEMEETVRRVEKDTTAREKTLLATMDELKVLKEQEKENLGERHQLEIRSLIKKNEQDVQQIKQTHKHEKSQSLSELKLLSQDLIGEMKERSLKTIMRYVTEKKGDAILSVSEIQVIKRNLLHLRRELEDMKSILERRRRSCLKGEAIITSFEEKLLDELSIRKVVKELRCHLYRKEDLLRQVTKSEISRCYRNVRQLFRIQSIIKQRLKLYIIKL